LTQIFPTSTPSGTNPIDQAVAIAADAKLLPAGARGVNLRMLAAQRRGEEGRYALNRYLRERGDAKFKSVEDMFATPTFLGNIDNLKAAFGETAKTLDTPAHTNHTLRIQTLQKILYKVMADNKLDALVYPYSTIPPHIILASRQAATYNNGTEPRILKTGTPMSDANFLPGEPVLKTDLDLYRGASGSWSVNLSPVSGFPAIVVPAGFTKEAYDRVPDLKDPNGSRLVGPKPDQLPVSLEFLARPFEEAMLFEIASAFEAGTKHRRAPKGFGPLKGEP
jgi:Asp-tRNA(Asn)/Glu-tRNA(Gln) amidotransferase A subunit family amidase